MNRLRSIINVNCELQLLLLLHNQSHVLSIFQFNSISTFSGTASLSLLCCRPPSPGDDDDEEKDLTYQYRQNSAAKRCNQVKKKEEELSLPLSFPR